jgi:hypothetical protein
VGMTLARYSHLLPDMQAIAVKAMDHTLQQALLSSELSSTQEEEEMDSSNGEE